MPGDPLGGWATLLHNPVQRVLVRRVGHPPRLGRIDVLVIDDWAMAPLNENERREVWEICEDRYQTRSTILTSQLLVSRWHEQIGDPTIAVASSTVWCTTLIASRCAASPCGSNAIRRRTRRKNEPNL
jgi:DNA replication protein DnaC